jgi:hypothetical protein
MGRRVKPNKYEQMKQILPVMKPAELIAMAEGVLDDWNCHRPIDGAAAVLLAKYIHTYLHQPRDSETK